MKDVIIVGQGLAGSLLAVALIERGQDVLVVDNGLKTSATKVAAGMMNPVTGKRLVKLWNRSEDEATVCAYYRHLEFVLGMKFLHCFTQYRFLNRPEELKALPKRLNDTNYLHYIKSIDFDMMTRLSELCDIGQDQFCIEKVYQLNTVLFLEAVKRYLQKHNAYKAADFAYAEINLTENKVSWQGIYSKKLVFCEGARGVENPFFKDILEFENAYGHILNISIPQLKERMILNHGKWLCPDLIHGEFQFRYGTTTYWENKNKDAETALNVLQSSLASFLKVDYSIDTVQNALRPVMRDRTPKSLWHPVYTQLGIINGLGGQGISRCPSLINGFISSISY